MLSVQEALDAIAEETRPFPVRPIVLADTLGLVLAEDIVSDLDSPPFDKAQMDGFAVRSADVAGGTATLELIEEITAGRVAQLPITAGQATQIMTGAPIPDGADAVVRVEDTEIIDGPAAAKSVKIDTHPVRPGTNMMHRGTSMRCGDRVVPAGRLLRPQELAALAEMGRANVLVRRRPRIGVLATGDELVPIGEQPGPGEIRNSNETMLVAQIQRAGGVPVPLGIARDERGHLRERILAGLDCDMLLLSGGVSAGKLDLVPAELAAAGVRQVFHKVRVKPGKPLWFGVLADESCGEDEPPVRRYVFGLPGNPVSSMVCFELFVRTAIRQLMGRQPIMPTAVRAALSQEHAVRGDRPAYVPARLDSTETGPVVTPVKWQGSADLRATVDANAMALFPAGEKTYKPDDPIEVFAWD